VLPDDAPQHPAGAGGEVGPALGTRRPRLVLRLGARDDTTEALAELVPGQAVGIAGMDLAEVALLADLERPERGGDDLGGLDGAWEDAGVERVDVAQLIGPREPVPQRPGLAATEVRQARAPVVAADDLVDRDLRLPVPDEDDPGGVSHQARLSTKPSS
jgi:hypothetical protein